MRRLRKRIRSVDSDCNRHGRHSAETVDESRQAARICCHYEVAAEVQGLARRQLISDGCCVLDLPTPHGSFGLDVVDLPLQGQDSVYAPARSVETRHAHVLASREFLHPNPAAAVLERNECVGSALVSDDGVNQCHPFALLEPILVDHGKRILRGRWFREAQAGAAILRNRFHVCDLIRPHTCLKRIQCVFSGSAQAGIYNHARRGDVEYGPLLLGIRISYDENDLVVAQYPVADSTVGKVAPDELRSCRLGGLKCVRLRGSRPDNS